MTPGASATAVSANGKLVLNFSENVSAGNGSIVLSGSDGSSVTIAANDASQVSVSGGTVTIHPASALNANTTYTVSVAAGAFTDAAGNAYAGLDGQTFTTASSVVSLAAVGTQVAGFTIIGETAGDHSGYSVAAAGDVNGDGLGDLIIGAPNYDAGGTESTGRAYVVFGKAGMETVNLADIAAGKGGGFVINGGSTTGVLAAGGATTTVGFQVGMSVSGAGDVNGDGLADLLIGAPYQLGQNNDAYGGGKYYVVYGKASSTSLNITGLGSSGYGINGNATGKPTGTAIYNVNPNLGAAVAQVGDTTGDGSTDLVAAAPGWDIGNTTSSSVDVGRVTLVVGSFTSGGIGNSAATYANYVGARAGDQLGSSVAAGGDFNGDGLADVVLSGASTDGNGVTYLIFGRSAGTLGATLDTAGLAKVGISITGASAGDMAGLSAVGVGDVNGDGLADLLIGAKGADVNGMVDAGRSYVVFGRTGNANIQLSDVANGTGGFVINGEHAGDASGYKVAAAGDLNGDGLADMLISSNAANTAGGTGRTYVVYGTASSAPVELSAIAAGHGGFVIDGAIGSGPGGASVGAAGDINGDGLGDLIVSSPQAEVTVNVPDAGPAVLAGAGASYVIFGSTGGAFQASTVDQLADGSQATINGSAASETLVGDAGANTLVGNGGADVIHAGAGNDTIVLNASNVAALQALYGSGDNTAQLARIDGGGGIDTLRLDGSGINLDLSAIHDAGLVGGINMSRLSSIEKIDLTGSGNDSLKLTMADVVDIAGFNSFNTSTGSGWTSTVLGAVEGRHQLLIDGDAGDSVTISGAGWTDAGTATYNGHTYEVYRNGSYAELLIDTSIARTLV
jgi:hypothetical protein